jgi:hypothetical protein
VSDVDSLAAHIETYQNTAAHNDGLYQAFTRLTDGVPVLKQHRDWVEAHKWGYGDRAFHYLWFLLLRDLAERFPTVSALEIGVYKGQTISLWALIARRFGLDLRMTAISPFEGTVRKQPHLIRRLRRWLDRHYRETAETGNLYFHEDYLRRNQEIFEAFELDFSAVRVIKGYSNDSAVARQVAESRFALLYIDGDHSLEVARSDIATYGPLVEEGGYLVMDDASWFLPGSGFWRGREAVSIAAEDVPSLGFTNVLNVGHNRAYRRTRACR